MSLRSVPVLLAIAVPILVAGSAPQNEDPVTGLILSNARQALGGEAALSGVRTFTASGSHTRTSGRLSDSFEVSCELPDKYLVETRAAGRTAFDGFNGEGLIHELVPPWNPPIPTTSAALLLAIQKDSFVRLTLPLFAASFPAYPLRFQLLHRRMLPTGEAAVIQARGPGGYLIHLFVDTKTNLPVMLSWNAPPLNPEVTITDYRVVDGVNWPHRMTMRYSGMLEDTRIDKFKINPKISPSKFKVSK